MRKLLLSTLAAAGALAAAAPAMAQDAAAEQAPFTGFRAEGLVGYDNLSDGSGQDSGSSSGVVYGGAVGYDFQAGGVVIGIEGEITGATTDTRADGLLVAGDRLRVNAGRDLYAGARIGFLASPQTLIYAKGGYTNARVETIYTSGATRVETGDNLDGFRVGAGIEYAVGPNLYLKGEYRYSNYSSVDGFDIDVDRHQAVAGICFRF